MKMRSSLEILEDIRKTLKEKRLTVECSELDKEINASTTAGELCLRSGSILLKLKKQNEKVEQSIGDLIEEFIIYCNTVGLFPVEKK